MRIIKYGIKLVDKSIELTCPKCGTVFEVTRKEMTYSSGMRPEPDFFFVACPVCGKQIWRRAEAI